MAGATIGQSIAPTQRAAIVYNTSATVPTSVRNKSSLVILGRTPSNPGITEGAAAGAIMLQYIDFILYNTTGVYHTWFFGTSSGSPAISAYPDGGTQWGSPANLIALTDAQLRTKLDSTIRKMNNELPWMTGLFLDDCGPDWSGYDSLSASVKESFYQKHVVMAIKIRELADELGLFLLTNGMWFSNNNHGYPVRSTQGCSLYDSVCIEHHDFSEAPFWDTVGNGQWRLRDPGGQRCMFHICNTSSDTSAWANHVHVAWIAQQTTPQYVTSPPPVSLVLTPHDLQLSFGAAPSITVTVTPNPITVQTGATQQFTGVASNGGALTWLVDGVVGGSVASGTVSGTGLYTAPSAAPTGGVVTVSARVVSGESGSSSVTVTQSVPPPPSPSLPPPPSVNKFIGNRFNGTIANNMTPDFVRGIFATATENGVLTSLWSGVDGLAGGTASQPYTMRVYAVDANGNPTTLMCSTSEVTLPQATIRTPTPETLPYDPRHPIYQPIPQTPVLDPNSATSVASNPLTDTFFDTGSNSPNVYVGQSTDPTWTLTILGVPYSVKAPATMAAGTGVDGPLIVLEPNSTAFGGYDIEYRMFVAVVNNTNKTVTCTHGGVGVYNNDGVLYSGGPAIGRAQIAGSHTGSGQSYMSGMLRPLDFQVGSINHAVRVAGYTATSFMYPADRSDGAQTYPTGFKMGSRIFLPRSTNLQTIYDAIDAYVDGGDPTIMNTLARNACKAIVLAMRDYGFAMHDSKGGGGWNLYSEGNTTANWTTYWGPVNPFGSWNHLGRCLKNTVPWSTLQVAAESNWAVVPNTATTAPTGAWINAPIVTGSTGITAGSTYFLALHSGGTEATGRFYRNDNPSASRSLADVYADGPVSSMSGSTTGTADMSIFAEYRVLGTSTTHLIGSVSMAMDAAGKVTAAGATGITNVMYINVPITRTYAIPYEDLGDGVTGRRLRWNAAQTRFEYDE